MRMMRIAGAATVLALGAFIFVMVRRERHADPESRRITNPESQIPSRIR